MPLTAEDLKRHNRMGIRQGDEAYGVRRLTSGRGDPHKTEAVRINGTLTTNDSEFAVKWAIGGHGILIRTERDIKEIWPMVHWSLCFLTMPRGTPIFLRSIRNDVKGVNASERAFTS